MTAIGDGLKNMALLLLLFANVVLGQELTCAQWMKCYQCNLQCSLCHVLELFPFLEGYCHSRAVEDTCKPTMLGFANHWCLPCELLNFYCVTAAPTCDCSQSHNCGQQPPNCPPVVQPPGIPQAPVTPPPPNTPIIPPPTSPPASCVQNTDCTCVAVACRDAITSVSTGTDCYGNCYKQCIANALGGVCSGTIEAANFAPVLVFSPLCRSVPQDACVIDFGQPSVTQCQTSSGCQPPANTTSPAPGLCSGLIASAGGGCVTTSNPFQGVTLACPCSDAGLLGVGPSLRCDCEPGASNNMPPTCSDDSIAIDSSCGVCNCPQSSVSCEYSCSLGLGIMPS
jgi:hypothetical protein